MINLKNLYDIEKELKEKNDYLEWTNKNFNQNSSIAQFTIENTKREIDNLEKKRNLLKLQIKGEE